MTPISVAAGPASLVLLSFLLAIACGGSGPDPRSTAATTAAPSPAPSPTATAVTTQASPTAHATQTPEVLPPPTHPAGAKTGIASVDEVVALVLAKDISRLVDRIVYVSVPCQLGVVEGRDVQCMEEEAQGTPVEALVSAACEEFYVRRTATPEFLSRSSLVEIDFGLYAVYVPGPSGEPEPELPAKHVIVFAADQLYGPDSPSLLLDEDGGVLAILLGCGRPEAMIPADAEYIFPPAG